MVLETSTGSEQRHLVIGCGGRSDMAENGDRTTPTPATATTPPSSSSPPIILVKGQSASMGPSDGAQKDDHVSPMCNGASSFSSSPHIKEERSSDCECEVQQNGHSSEKNSLPLPTVVKEEDEEEEVEETCAVMSMKVKQEEELDAPLDFSLRRRDSVSESFTDDSRASSSNSPPHYVPFSSSISPDHAQQQQLLQQFILKRRQRHDSSGSHDGQGPALQVPQVNKSPSPDHGSQSQSGPKASSASGQVPLSSANVPLAALNMVAEGSTGIPPAALAAILGQNGGMMGSLSSLSALVSEARKTQSANGGKVQRPFKAYPKEALQMPLGYLNLRGVNPFPAIDLGVLQGLTVTPDDVMTLYKQQAELLKEQEKQMLNASKRSSRSPPSSTLSASPSPINGSSHVAKAPPPSTTSVHFLQSSTTISGSPSPRLSPQSHASPTSLPSSQAPASVATDHSATSTPSSSPFPTPSGPPQVTSTSSATTSSGSRKRPRTMPDCEKDDAYWERRRKNNDAAKRSRDARRAKEDEIAIRAALLEQENLKLRVEVAALKTETARLRCLLYNT